MKFAKEFGTICIGCKKFVPLMNTICPNCGLHVPTKPISESGTEKKV
jgi:rRNA maturation endonuclease Nob1